MPATGVARPLQRASTGRDTSPMLGALMRAAVGLPGMFLALQGAQAAPDDAVNAVALKDSGTSLPSNALTVVPDEAQEVGLQFSRYREAQRNILGAVGTTTIPATANSPVTGQNFLFGALPSYPGIQADGEHFYARFRSGDHTRLGFDFVRDVWSGASPIYDQPLNVSGSASKGVGGYFDAQGHPLVQTAYQANANPNLSNGTPQKYVMTRDDRITHAMGTASPETRNQGSLKFGYDWERVALDLGAGITSEPDFTAHFGNVGVRLDFNDKRTTVNVGLGLTRGDTHAQWAIGFDGFKTDAYPHGVGQVIPVMTMHQGNGYLQTASATVVTGSRSDDALTAGVTQVLGRNDLASTGVGFTHTTGFLTNPWRGSLVLFPTAPADSNVLARYPTSSYLFGYDEFERRPGLRDQFTWDTSYLHYFQNWNAAANLHYGLFVDSWGVVAHTFEAEWRQELDHVWVVTPRLRYYTQRAADFYAPYFVAPSAAALPSHYFSSDERLSPYGSVNPSLTFTRQFARGLKAELGWEYSKRSGAWRLGGGGVGDFADIRSNTWNLSLVGSLDRLIATDFSAEPIGGDAHAAHGGHGSHAHGLVPAGVMGADIMDEPGSVMIGYDFESDRQGVAMMRGTAQAPAPSTSITNMRILGMTMDMHMIELMWTQNHWLSWMLMPQIVNTDMGMYMFMVAKSMGYMNDMRTFMDSGGAGDTMLSANLRLWSAAGQTLSIAQGISIPTGASNLRSEFSKAVLPPDMQLGSGTWDYKPDITYQASDGRWSWGAQGAMSLRLQHANSQGYGMGHQDSLTAWCGYRVLNWLNASLRLQHKDIGTITGTVPTPDTYPWNSYYTTDYNPANYGGHFNDAGLGISSSLGTGVYAADRVSLEWLEPIRTDFNGLQPRRIGSLFASVKFMF